MMPTWFKVLVSSLLVSFMIALSASVEAEAAPVDFDGRGFVRLDSVPDVFWVAGDNVSTYGTYSPDVSDIYAFCYSPTPLYKYVSFVYCPRDGKIDPDTLYSSYIVSGSSAFPAVSFASLAPASSFSPASSYSSFRLDSSYDRYMFDISVNSSSVVSSGMYVYSDWNDGLRDVVDYVSSAPSVDFVPFSYDLLPGYALYLDVSGLSSVSVSSSISSNSGIYRSTYRSNQYLRFVDSLPVSGDTLQPSGEQLVYSGIGDKNFIGLYRQAIYGHTFSSSRDYLVIYNPLGDVKGGSETGNGNNVNPVMHVNVSLVNLAGSRLYSLSTNIMSDGLVSDVSGDYGLVDSDGSITAVDASGNTYTPVVGGSTLVDAPSDINDFLQSIANDVSGFFNGAVSAVKTLVKSGSAFIGLLSQLYTWLPAEVFSVLKSALVLVITIGVIKVFV